MSKGWFVILIGLISILFPGGSAWGSSDILSKSTEQPPHEEAVDKDDLKNLSIERCLDIALANNHQRPVSQFDLAAAEAQHKQALSSFWPQLSFRSTFLQMDEDPNFIFPATTMSFSSQTLTIPANAFGPGFPASPLPMSIPGGSFKVPEQDVKLMDKRNLVNSLNLNYPLFTGGMRSAKVKQAKQGIEAAKQDARRTDLQVSYDVKRMYYGALLAKQLRKIGEDTLARLEVTLEFTENVYKKGSGKVKKTDYLRNKVAVEAARSLVAQLISNESLAKAALINTTGLSWNSTIELSATEIPYMLYEMNLPDLVNNAYEFNPDWAKLKAGLEAAQAKIKEARSGHFPRIVLVGSLNHIENEYDKGIVSDRNKDNWSAGIVMELPLFEGFLTQNKIRESQALFNKLEEQKILLQEGIALQVKDLYFQLARSRDQYKAAGDGALAAEENRELNERSYQYELVETKDVLEAQMMDSNMKAQYQKVLFDHVETKARLDFVIGREVSKLIKAE